MKFMKLGSKPDCFQSDGKDIRFVAANLAADIIVHVGNVKFHLHKFPLLSKSYRVQKLLTASDEDEADEICIPDIPGGATAFELCAKFCYGMTLTLDAHNVAAARCAAEYLEMHETVDKGNLIYKIEVFLRTSIFRSWKDSIIVLQMTRSLLPWAEDLKLINHCIDSIATKSSTDASKVEWSYTYSRKKNGATTKENSVPKDWWIEDLCELETDFFRKVILAIKTRGRVSSEVIGEALKVYTYRRFSCSGKGSAKKEGECINASFIETIISLLPTEKNCVSCSFLLKLLRAGSLLHFDEASKKELVKYVGHQLEDASVHDLLIPATSDEKTIYDVDMIFSIVEEFMMREDQKAVAEEYQELSSAALASGSSIIAIAKLVDGCLVEIAKDPNLPLSKFIALAEILPSESRPAHDELYRAINILLKEHPGISKSEKKILCSLINCKKLSVDSCAHAVQNESLPLRMVVQVLYFEQMRVSASTAGAQTESGASYESSRSAATTNAEDESDRTAAVGLETPKSTEPVDSCNGDGKIKSNGKVKGTVTPKKILGKLLPSKGQAGDRGNSLDMSGSPNSAEETKSTPARKARQSIS